MLAKPFIVPGKHVRAVLTQRSGEKVVGRLTTSNGGIYAVGPRGQTFKMFKTVEGAKKWARATARKFDSAAEGRGRSWNVTRNPVSLFQKRDALWQAFLNAKTDTEADRLYKQHQQVMTAIERKHKQKFKSNPAQVAKVQARGGKRFVVATHSSETNEQLLDRVNAVKVIKRVNTNPKRRKTLGAGGVYEGSAYSKAVSLGYPYVRGDGKVADDGKTWLNRFSKSYDGKAPAVFVGWNDSAKHWIVERENPSSPVNEWDDPPEFSDEDLNDAARQGWLGAGAMRREHGKRAAGPKYFNVTWYSKQRGKRTGFIRPIEAQSRAQAVKQAKAMIENEKGVSNFVAKEVRGNPAKAINVSIGEKIAQLTREGTPHNQAVAIAFSEKRAGKVNPDSVYERDVKTIERAIRKVISAAKRDRSIAMGKANIKQVLWSMGGLRSSDLFIPPSAFASAFDDALARVKPKGFTILNPSTREMSQRFNGQASGAIVELKASNSAPSDLSRGGRFILLKLVDSSKALRIPGALVSIDPKTERLWIVGDRAPLLNRRAKPGERLNCGEIERIVYETAKRHIGRGKTFEYDHEFVAPRPSLYIDAEGMPLIVGGEYKIRREGIVN